MSNSNPPFLLYIRHNKYQIRLKMKNFGYKISEKMCPIFVFSEKKNKINWPCRRIIFKGTYNATEFSISKPLLKSHTSSLSLKKKILEAKTRNIFATFADNAGLRFQSVFEPYWLLNPVTCIQNLKVSLTLKGLFWNYHTEHKLNILWLSAVPLT